MAHRAGTLVVIALSFASRRATAADDVGAAVEREKPGLGALYQHLHAHPELSFHEKETAARMARELSTLGFEVKTGVGGHGVVGLLKNGAGPTVMLRTDLDALPVVERTGVSYASQIRVKDDAGQEVGVMHACGHDLHMTSWVGAARALAGQKDRWSGTLMMIAQPAEEKGRGAQAMLADGLFAKIARPHFAVALHASAELPAGVVGYTSGHALANVDEIDITVFGKGGHGAYPHKTIDPIVIASRIVVTLQTIVAREVDPIESAVVTVGSIHGGSKHNIIPDEVKMQLTVRSYKPAVRKQLLDAIARVATAEARAARAPKDPRVDVSKEHATAATFNDPGLTERAAGAIAREIGDKNVRKVPPVMGGEDFGEYGRAGVPAFIFWLGAVEPKKAAEAEKTGAALPSLHSPLFAPAYAPAIETGVRSLTAVALDLMAKPPKP